MTNAAAVIKQIYLTSDLVLFHTKAGLFIIFACINCFYRNEAIRNRLIAKPFELLFECTMPRLRSPTSKKPNLLTLDPWKRNRTAMHKKSLDQTVSLTNFWNLHEWVWWRRFCRLNLPTKICINSARIRTIESKKWRSAEFREERFVKTRRTSCSWRPL